jgi:hypothetical protein
MHTCSRTALFTCLGMCISAPILAAPQGFEWFPRVPGPGDQLYLIVNDPCHSTSPIAPILETISVDFLDADSENAFLELQYETDLFFCNLAPPTIDAIAIPRQVDGVAVETLYSFNEQRIFENGQPTGSNITSWIESLPPAVAIPPAIAGTWFSATHAEQGLLINMTAKRELLVGWTTYGADGKQRWFSGIAPTVSDESTVTLTLTDTGDGAFAGQLPNDAPQQDWGTLTIEYAACGEIDVRWNPKANTGLQPGTATMQQLTLPHDAACDIEAYAAALGKPLTIHELDIETAPQPAN